MQNLPYIFLAILLHFLHKESLSHKHEGISPHLHPIHLSKQSEETRRISHPSNLNSA
jgi:hypothetical protein